MSEDSTTTPQPETDAATVPTTESPEATEAPLDPPAETPAEEYVTPSEPETVPQPEITESLPQAETAPYPAPYEVAAPPTPPEVATLPVPPTDTAPLVTPTAPGLSTPYPTADWGAPAGAGQPFSAYQTQISPATPAAFDAAAVDAATREAERQQRNRQLGTITPPPEPYVHTAPAKADNDKALGSLGLFLLRLITAGVIGVRAYQMFTRHDAAVLRLTERGAPEPELIAWTEAGVLALIAVALFIGFGTRLSAFLLAAAAIANIVFMQWGAFDPLRSGVEGIRGDFELLLAAIGLTLLVLGSGGWAIDGIRRASKAKHSSGY